MPDTFNSANTDVIINELKHIRQDINVIKQDMKCLEEFKRSVIKDQTRLEVKVGTVIEHGVEHEHRIKTIESDLSPLKSANKILVFVGSTFLLTLLGFVWMLITHQITLGG